jgi:hypothetical protein
MLLHPGVTDVQSILQLQRSMGNQAVCELLGLRSKLEAGSDTSASDISRHGPHPEPTRKKGTASTSGGPIQRKFGFEIELPVMLTERVNTPIKSLAGGADITMKRLPQDPKLNGNMTHLADLTDSYINLDHNRTLDGLHDLDLKRYATRLGLDANATASLEGAKRQLMPENTSIAEVVTEPWDESALDRAQAKTKVQAVITDVNKLFVDIAGDRATLRNGFRFGSQAPNSTLFQPRLGYFHATYGMKLSQVPRLFEKTTEQKKALRKYAETRNLPQREHARNLEKTSQSVAAAQDAMKQIKRLWPRVVVPRKILPDARKLAMSSASEKDFLGLLTLLANYFLSISVNTGGDDLGKNLVGMHYYKSDLHDVATQLPAEVIDRLQNSDVLMDGVIDALCGAVGIDRSDRLNGGLRGYTLRGYLLQIFRGNYGVIKDKDGDDILDASGKTFMDPVLAKSINPYSSKLGPEQLGPAGNQGLGVVLENRHLEYLNPNYGDLLDTEEQRGRNEAAQYIGPKMVGAPDPRTAQQKAMFESIGAREEGPARRPIGEWEGMMMNIYDMVKGLNND